LQLPLNKTFLMESGVMSSPQRSSQWDVGRFFSTLNYFGEVPFLGSFRWIQQWLGQSPVTPGRNLSAMKQKILVIGAETDQNSQLLKKTFQSATSVEIAFLNWPESVNRTDGGLSEGINKNTSAGTAIPESQFFLSQVQPLIHSADGLVLLSPPHGLEATTKLLDEIGQYWATAAAAVTDQLIQTLFDFSQPDSDVTVWGALDDVVMGGVSQGSIFLRAQPSEPPTSESLTQAAIAMEGFASSTHAVFAGNVSTDNSGGFSSVRTKNFEPPFNFSGWQGIQLRVKGDGQRYKFISRNSAGWDSPAYIYSFDTVADRWITLNISFADMVPTFRARSVANAPAFDPAMVYSFQLMLSKFEYDRQLNPHFKPGPFELAIARIALYRPRSALKLIVIGDSADLAQTPKAAPPSIDYRQLDSSQSDWLSQLNVVVQQP
jgi:hypothetical protein